MAIVDKIPSRSTDTYIDGFLGGMAAAYCEMVQCGVRLAGSFECDVEHKDRVLSLIAAEGCRAIVIEHADARASVWVYKHPRVELLIRALQNLPAEPSPLAVWANGKIFGYSDLEVLDYVSGLRSRPGLESTTRSKRNRWQSQM